MLNIWTKPSGYTWSTNQFGFDGSTTYFDQQHTIFDIGPIVERISVLLPLPVVLPTVIPTTANAVPYDGTGHHPTAPLRNAAGTPFTRYPINSYVDGIWKMRTDLPNPRTVSNLVVYDPVNQGNQPDPNGYSGFMYAWGQFITHEIEFARGGTQNIDVIVPPNDAFLTPGSHIPVNRLLLAPGTGRNGIVANFINDTTGWIDGTVIYGLAYPPGIPQGTTVFQNPVNLRDGGINATTGKLLTSSGGLYGPIDPSTGMFIFGDPRGTENPDLTSVQTLLIREHNWHVARLTAQYPAWTGEQLYQRARALVIAEEQIITYKEWVPKVVGAGAIPAYTGFKDNIDATIRIEFAAAAMRFGHSIVSGAQDRVDEQGNITESVTLGQAFFLTPAQYERNGGADGFLRKLASDISNKLDVHIIEDLRNLLNDPPAAMDLAATNIQRGRDLGLPSLNQMRQILGLFAYTSFEQITIDATVVAGLKAAYTNINDIDLWIGGLAEDPVNGAMVGPTFRAIMIDQFIKIRDGDALWWENKLWSPEDLLWLQGVTLSDMILRNTSTQAMQPDAFVAVERADLYNGTVASISTRTYPTLPAQPLAPTNPITFSIISGALPPGLAVVGNTIKGIPYGVVRDTTYTFCIRASDGKDIADRTFSITVATGGPPVWQTDGGLLPIGTHNQRYILNNSFIDYQIVAKDLDNQPITYYIASGDGELPPGVTLTPDGKLTGFVNPILAITEAVTGVGAFDQDLYDSGFYDFASRPSNGYDSYIYDQQTFDFSTPTLPPKSINQRYEFIVTAAAGSKIIKRTFGIFVVSPELLTADDAVIKDDSTVFTADVTPLEPPLFSTDRNLGIVRANNYITIEINTYTSSTTSNPIFSILNNAATWTALTSYNVDTPVTYLNSIYICATAHKSSGVFSTINNNTTYWVKQTLPSGLAFSPVGSVIYLAGFVPFQTNISKTYTFGIVGTRTGSDVQSAVTTKIFVITVIGEINNKVTWITSPDLGSIPANYNSNLNVQAIAQDTTVNLIYSLDIQSTEIGLPPGLSLDVSGEITGKVNQFGVQSIHRITTFENGNWYLDRKFTTIDANHQYDIVGPKGLILFDQDTGFNIDQGNTTFDRIYKFTIKATDQYGYAVSNQQFRLQVSTPNQILYSNIRTQPYLKPSQRGNWTTFINDPTIFSIGSIYRPADPNFGTRTDLGMLVYAGIETKQAAAYVGAMGLNHKHKRFHFSTVKKAVAKINGSTVYEVVYVEMIDPLEANGNALPHSIKYNTSSSVKTTADISNAIQVGAVGTTPAELASNLATMNLAESWLDRPIDNVTVDSNAFHVSDAATNTFYPSSITNWQRNIESIGLAERNYLPVWMRTIQPGEKQQLGFKLAVPLCYCKPGTADSIILNIKHSGFDFRTLDYTVDRYIIDSVDGYSNDKYLVFRNDRITV